MVGQKLALVTRDAAWISPEIVVRGIVEKQRGVLPGLARERATVTGQLAGVDAIARDIGCVIAAVITSIRDGKAGGTRACQSGGQDAVIALLIAVDVVNLARRPRTMSADLGAQDIEVAPGQATIIIAGRGKVCAAADAVPILVALFDPNRREAVGADGGADVIGEGFEVGVAERVGDRNPRHRADGGGQRIDVGAAKVPIPIGIEISPGVGRRTAPQVIAAA